MNAIAWTDDGFTVAGQAKSGAPSGLGVLHLGRSGEARGGIVPLPWPSGDLPAGGQMTAETRKLVALPNGAVALLAVITAGEGSTVRQTGWVVRIAANGRVAWSRTFASAPVSIVLHSGQYDPQGDRLIVVGRRTLGADEGRCQSWSQSLVITLRASDGEQIAPAFTQGDQGKTPTSRQALWDVTAGDKPGTFAVAGFATTANPTAAGKCKDNMFAATLVPDGNKWKFAAQGRVGSKDANEVAFSIRAAGAGGYLLAGHHRDSPSDAPAAQAYRVKLAPFAVVAPPLSTPYPPDGSDKTGGDRYRVIIPLPDKKRFLLAGSVSASGSALNQGMWQIVSADLKDVDSPVIVSNAGSDIMDAAISSDGKILAVGRWTDDDGRRVGFTGFIGGPPNGNNAIAWEHRPPDSRLTDLMSLRSSDGTLRVPASALAAGAGYFGRNLAAGSRIDMAFSISATRPLKVSALAASGDVDIVILDAAKRPVAFSNYRTSAAQLIIKTLAAGEYTLSIIAHTPVPACEIRLAFSGELGTRAVTELARLSQEERVELANALAAAGFSAAPDPTIALGGETARALLAAQEGAQRPIGPGSIGKSLEQNLGGP